MAIFKKELLGSYVVAVLAFGIFCLSFATSTHFAPKTLRQLITLDHQVRRVLNRAERENLRSNLASEREGMVANPLDEIGVALVPLKLIIGYYKVSSSSQTILEPKSFVIDLSPVLNL